MGHNVGLVLHRMTFFTCGNSQDVLALGMAICVYEMICQCGTASTITGHVPSSHVIQADITKNATPLSILYVRLHGNIPDFSCSSIRTCFLVFHVDQKPSTRICHLYAWLQPTQTSRLPWQPCALCENYTPYLADLH